MIAMSSVVMRNVNAWKRDENEDWGAQLECDGHAIKRHAADVYAKTGGGRRLAVDSVWTGERERGGLAMKLRHECARVAAPFHDVGEHALLLNAADVDATACRASVSSADRREGAAGRPHDLKRFLDFASALLLS